MMRSAWIGYEPREAEAFAVARQTLKKKSAGVSIHALHLETLRKGGLYTRPTSTVRGQMWDDISDAPMSTEFAISRFLVPYLARSGWALFMDCDMLVRHDVSELFALADPSKAVMCVQHQYEPAEHTKMDGQAQTAYARKNWSSVILFNCDHPANQALTVELVNTVPGRDLHRFCWLTDDLIGALPGKWNYLAEVQALTEDPAIVHYTLGHPNMPGHEFAPYAHEWRSELLQWLGESVPARGRPTTWTKAA
jgi:hypothetical protein